MEKLGKLFIVLPVYNRKEVTLHFFKQLSKQSFQNYQAILIDDGSKDGTTSAIKEFSPSTVDIQGDGNLWWGGSLHQAYLWIKKNLSNNPKEDAVLIINDDTFFENNFLENGLKLLANNEKALVFSKCYDFDTKQLIDQGVTWDWENLSCAQAANENQINCCSTRGLFIRLHDYIKLGAMYPKLIPHFLSDYEYGIRANQQGFKIMTSDSVFVSTKSEPSGFVTIHYSSIKKFKDSLLSKKNYNQPIYYLNFIILRAPTLRLKLKGSLKIFKEFIGHLKRLLKESKELSPITNLVLIAPRFIYKSLYAIYFRNKQIILKIFYPPFFHFRLHLRKWMTSFYKL